MLGKKLHLRIIRGNGYPKYRSKEFKCKENGYVKDVDLNKIEI